MIKKTVSDIRQRQFKEKTIYSLIFPLRLAVYKRLDRLSMTSKFAGNVNSLTFVDNHEIITHVKLRFRLLDF
jgi:shikimate 5-dehydrogenase